MKIIEQAWTWLEDVSGVLGWSLSLFATLMLISALSGCDTFQARQGYYYQPQPVYNAPPNYGDPASAFMQGFSNGLNGQTYQPAPSQPTGYNTTCNTIGGYTNCNTTGY